MDGSLAYSDFDSVMPTKLEPNGLNVRLLGIRILGASERLDVDRFVFKDEYAGGWEVGLFHFDNKGLKPVRWQGTSVNQLKTTLQRGKVLALILPRPLESVPGLGPNLANDAMLCSIRGTDSSKNYVSVLCKAIVNRLKGDEIDEWKHSDDTNEPSKKQRVVRGRFTDIEQEWCVD